ncbi:MAG TPA: DUF748 domain-containing protein [Myxococcota bacterium]|jgi:hypothetical protein|nr:DUF748 domain-containing protein [Myxococcota bacterium]
MNEPGPSAAATAAAALVRRLWARRRNRILLALFVLAVAVRIALPYVVRKIAVDQADKALVGRIELDDVDLSLVTGGITLHGLRVFANELTAERAAPTSGAPGGGAAAQPPPADAKPSAADAAAPAPVTAAAPGPPGSAPVFATDRLTVDLGFLALLHKTIEVQRFELEKFAVNVDRARDGTLVLPKPVPSEKPPEPAAEKEQGPGWGVLVRTVKLHDGAIGFRDFAVGDPPQDFSVVLPHLEAEDLALVIREGGLEPGKVVLDASIQGGQLHYEASIENLVAGPAVESHVTLTGLPIRSSRAYIPTVQWSDLSGLLDCDLIHRFESQGAHTLRGKVALRDLDVMVKGLEPPAVAWKELGVELRGIDVVKQHAAVESVSLDGLRIVTRPGGAEPVPVLHGLVRAATEGAKGAPEAAATPAPAPEKAAKPWTWELSKVLLHGAQIQVQGEEGNVDIGADVEAASLASAPDTQSTLSVQITPPTGGPLSLAGTFMLQPVAFDGTLRAGGFVIPPLVRPLPLPQAGLLKSAVLDLELELAAGATPKAPTDGARVAGRIGLRDLELSGDDPKVFAVRLRDLAIALREATAPGVLAKGPDAKLGPIGVALASLTLTRPEIVVTRTQTGIALPEALGGHPEGGPAAGGAAPAEGAAPAAQGETKPPAAATAEATPPPAEGAAAKPALDVQVRVDRLAVQKMRVAVTDEAVKPVYHGSLDPIDLTASDVRWPGPFARKVRLVARGLEGARLTVTGDVAPAGSALVAKLEGLELRPFNPYAVSSGYGVGGGTAALDSTIKLGPGSYDTSSKLVLNKLQVTGTEGDSLFAAKFGMPLSLALGLMTDLQGNIVLDLPVAGDRSGTKIGIGTIVGDALERAILNAVTSPLKLIGAVASIGDKPSAIVPEPFVFEPGRDTLAEGEDAKLDQLGKLLAASPVLTIHLRGETSAEDRRWLQEQALLEKLDQESGVVGTLRHITERGERVAVLETLRARAEGQSAEVPAEYQDWFEAQVKAQPVSDAALKQLASARVTSIRSRLESDYGVATDRLVLDDTGAQDLAARPVVALGLGGEASRTPVAGASAGDEAPSVSGDTSGADASSGAGTDGVDPSVGR